MSKITIEHEGRICTIEDGDTVRIESIIEHLVVPALIGVGFSEALVKEELGYSDD